jgi:carbonic anhydrase
MQKRFLKLIPLFTFAITACSSAPEKVEAVAAEAPAAAPAAAHAAPDHPGGPSLTVSVPADAAHPNTAHADAHHEDSGVAPEKAIGWLKNGNSRFVKGWRRKDGGTANDRARLAKGQKPHTIVLSCSDSRVPPEHVFDQALGEIFVIRVAGEALDSSVIASIEYAVEHLGSKLIVVMGHESCGAVKAALATAEGSSAGSPDLDKLVADIKPRLPASAAPSPNVIEESKINANGVARDLLARSTLLRERVNIGKIKIVPAMYYLGSGRVEFF